MCWAPTTLVPWFLYSLSLSEPSAFRLLPSVHCTTRSISHKIPFPDYFTYFKLFHVKSSQSLTLNSTHIWINSISSALISIPNFRITLRMNKTNISHPLTAVTLACWVFVSMTRTPVFPESQAYTSRTIWPFLPWHPIRPISPLGMSLSSPLSSVT